MIPYERERSLAQADEAIESFIAGTGWKMELHGVGELIVTTKCTLRDREGGFVSSGCGKGESDISLVGAKYEAVEHYYSSAATITAEVGLVASEDILNDGRYACLPFLSVFEQNRGKRLACRTYRSFGGDGQIDVPLFMTCTDYTVCARPAADTFDYSSANRFSSNSGTAIGASFEEAAVHAAGEIIERDSWSLFMIAHFLGDPGSLGTVIDPDSLPAEVWRIHQAARKRLGRDIVLIDVTTDLGFPTFIATVVEIAAGEPVHPHGCGASLHAGYAAIRALTELVQYVDVKLMTEKMAHVDIIALEMLSGYRKLRDCAYFKVDPARLRKARWQHAGTQLVKPKPLLEGIVAKMRSKGINLYFCINHQQAESFCVVSCVSCELERFFLVTAGVVMAPGARGMRLLPDKQPEVSRQGLPA